MTLLELLKQDFKLVAGELDGELPRTKADRRHRWNGVGRAITRSPGFEVREQVTLGIVSLSKYLVWKGLELLNENRVVRHLIERGEEPFPGNGPLPEPGRLYVEVDAGDE